MEITDKECVQLWEDGKLSLSTAFWASVSATDVLGDVVPNHVLLFEEDDVNQPKDKGTLIQKGPAMTEKLTTTPVKNADAAPAEGGLIEALKALLERFGGAAPAAVEEVEAANVATKTPDPEGESIPTLPISLNPGEKVEDEFDPKACKPNKVDTMTAETDALNQKVVSLSAELANKAAIAGEKDAKIASMTSALAQKEADFKIAADILAEKELAIANKTKEIETVKAELVAFHQKENEAKFQAFIKQIPAGFSNKEEDVKVLRELWDNDPRALANKTIEMVQSVKLPVTKTEGKPVIADGAVANKTKKGMGRYNMEKHIWEDTQ